MRRILMAALLTIGGTFAMSSTASADIGDIRELSVDSQFFGSASQVDVTGRIRCAATIEYGLWVGVAQDGDGNNPNPDDIFFQEDEPTVGTREAPVEGVGAFGPNFDPPVGVSDDSPCSQSTQSWDVVVTQNRDSGDFDDGELEVTVMAGTSAEDGGRGPGPFIGDMQGLNEDSIAFERTR